MFARTGELALLRSSMYQYPLAIRKLIREISKLPSLGERSATRLAYHLVYRDKELAFSISELLKQAMEQTRFCQECFALSETDICSICSDPGRMPDLLCIVEKPIDLFSIERLGSFNGRYHVLHGLWSPMRGTTPTDLKFEQLIERVKRHNVKEAILATSSTLEGDATALFLASELKPLGVKVTRLAQGMPKGGELEYADEITLSRAFSGRNVID